MQTQRLVDDGNEVFEVHSDVGVCRIRALEHPVQFINNPGYDEYESRVYYPPCAALGRGVWMLGELPEDP